ncbi:MAG TPA: DUF2269 family protein [Longimicrobiales bacterium]
MYLALKAIHVFAVVLFLGNIATGVFWKAHADRTRDPRLIAHALDGIIRSDRLFTVPGVFVIIAGGVGAAIVGDLELLGTGWILWSIVLFSISGAAFMVRVAPLQRSMLDVARSGGAGSMDWMRYERLSRSWALWGATALLAPLVALFIMVLKPALPGL